MEILRDSSWKDYVSWYIGRLKWKMTQGRGDEWNSWKEASDSKIYERLKERNLIEKRDFIKEWIRRFDTDIPKEPDEQKILVDFLGKWHNWFSKGKWAVVTLKQKEFEALIPAYQEEGHSLLARRDLLANSGLLKNMAQEAKKIGFLSRSEHFWKGHKTYYQWLKKQEKMELKGINRIVICSTGDKEKREKNPDGYEHLEDGWGRCLPYQVLLEEGRHFGTVEAFYAVHPSKDFLDWCRSSR